jgi:hypothetical protein
MLVDHLDGIDREFRHRSGHQVDDRRNLAGGQLPPLGEAHHDRGRRGRVVAHEHRFLGLGEVHAHGLDPVDLHDREFQLAFARGLQALAFHGAAGAHWQLVEHLLAGFGRGHGAVGGRDHARLVEVVFPTVIAPVELSMR